MTLARFSASSLMMVEDRNIWERYRRPKHVGAIFYVYFNVNFNVLFKLIKVHLLVSELYIYHNARNQDKNSCIPLFWRKKD